MQTNEEYLKGHCVLLRRNIRRILNILLSGCPEGFQEGMNVLNGYDWDILYLYINQAATYERRDIA